MTVTTQRRASSILMGLGVMLTPALAWADGGCSSAFSSWGCFVLSVTLLGVAALPASLVGIIAGWFMLKHRFETGPRLGVLALCVPAAYLNVSLFVSLPESLMPAGPAFVLAATVVTTAMLLGELALVGWIKKKHDIKKAIELHGVQGAGAI